MISRQRLARRRVNRSLFVETMEERWLMAANVLQKELTMLEIWVPKSLTPVGAVVDFLMHCNKPSRNLKMRKAYSYRLRAMNLLTILRTRLFRPITATIARDNAGSGYSLDASLAR